jgi:hypothetical protein
MTPARFTPAGITVENGILTVSTLYGRISTRVGDSVMNPLQLARMLLPEFGGRK